VNDELLLFAYFKDHGDGLHLAWSRDGYYWRACNDDAILIQPGVGKEKIMRDPCVFPGHDGLFHLVWTIGWTEPGIGYCNSPDLINWSPQQYLPVMAHEAKARNSWAPEIFFYQDTGEYLIYWSSTVDGKFPETQPYGDDGYNHRIYYVATRDFRKFTGTRLLYDGGFNVIDANIVRDGSRYLLFMKNETLTPPAKNIRMAVGGSPFAFGEAGPPLTPNHYWAEGPTAIKIGDEWLVYFDRYKINNIGAIRSKDLVHWQEVSDMVRFPPGAQHGYVFKAPAQNVERLIYSKARFAPHAIVAD
jgi:beta-xylosidase